MQDALEQAQLSASTQKSDIEANYASYEDTVSRLLQEASDQALESAIARGGGHSDAVEWLTNQYSTPILEQAANQEKQRTADLNAIAEALALTEDQYSDNLKNLETQRGNLTSERAAELASLAQSTASSDWSNVATAIQNLMNSATQSQQNTESIAANLLQYLVPTVGQTMDYNLGVTNATGEVPESLSSVSTPLTTPVSLRNYATSNGATIDYDAMTQSVIINGKKYSTSDLQALGGQLVNGSWQIPQSAVDKLLGDTAS